MYIIETIKVTKLLTFIPVCIVSTATGIIILKKKSILKQLKFVMIHFYFFLNFANTENCTSSYIFAHVQFKLHDPYINIIFHKNRYLSTCNISLGAQTPKKEFYLFKRDTFIGAFVVMKTQEGCIYTGIYLLSLLLVSIIHCMIIS